MIVLRSVSVIFPRPSVSATNESSHPQIPNPLIDPMDSAHTHTKSKFARTIANALHAQTLIPKNPQSDAAAACHDAFIAKLFADVSAVKAAYARLQSAQSPYDAAEIQSADHAVISALNKLSGLRKSPWALTGVSPAAALFQAEIREANSLLVIYRVTMKNMDSRIKLKDSEITFLKEKLTEAEADNDLLENRILNSANVEMSISSGLSPTIFTAYFHQAVKSTRSFVRLLMREMEFASWDLELAAASINQRRIKLKFNHLCFAFESFVFRQMFDGFDRPNFSNDHDRSTFVEQFSEVKSVSSPIDYLAWLPNSKFAAFCRHKYLRVVHSIMESSIFGNLNQRNSVIGSSGSVGFPETSFFAAFCEMAMRVWVVHCLTMSFEPDSVSAFQVSRGSRFSEVYMESLNDEAFLESSLDCDVRVAFTVVPGFRVGRTVIQSQVYLG